MHCCSFKPNEGLISTQAILFSESEQVCLDHTTEAKQDTPAAFERHSPEGVEQTISSLIHTAFSLTPSGSAVGMLTFPKQRYECTRLTEPLQTLHLVLPSDRAWLAVSPSIKSAHKVMTLDNSIKPSHLSFWQQVYYPICQNYVSWRPTDGWLWQWSEK